jgi:hypothetical protein
MGITCIGWEGWSGLNLRWPASYCEGGSKASWPNDDGEIPQLLVTLDSAPWSLVSSPARQYGILQLIMKRP